MHARPVVGGFFIKMLSDRAMWHKWATGDKVKAIGWAPLPVTPAIHEVVATSRLTPINWSYTTEKPTGDWTKTEFDASSWKTGAAGFGTVGGARTRWNTKDIWIRRAFTMPEGKFKNLHLFVWHDEDVEIYVNGILAGTEGGFINTYDYLEITPAALALLKPGAQITLAAHCHQTGGGQYIDIGLAEVGAH